VSDTETRDDPEALAVIGSAAWLDGYLTRLTAERDEARAEVKRLQERVQRWDDVLLEKANRHQAEREAAEAEVARLRGVVEAVRALADEDRHHLRSGVVGMVRLGDLQEALASVPSSGEADTPSAEAARASLSDETLAAFYGPASGETGERLVDRVTGRPATAYTPPEDVVRVPASQEPTGAEVGGWVCSTCGHGSTEHGMEGHPAFECVYQPVWRSVARPVLSRERVDATLDGHFPHVVSPGELVRCRCGWRSDSTSPVLDTVQWCDHLADILTAGWRSQYIRCPEASRDRS
jgi:hypothetical protein